MSKFKIGDVVRLIPRSYHDLSKSGFNRPSTWKSPDPASDRELMLGGCYTVLEAAPPNGTFLRLLENASSGEGWISEEFLWFDEEVDNCPFEVGDKVYFRPTPFDDDTLSLKQRAYYDFRDADKSHVIRFVLNQFYIFLDFELEDPDFYASPFRWIGFDLK